MVLTKFGEGFDEYSIEKERMKHTNRLNSLVAPNFYQVLIRKNGYRSTISKKISNYLSSVTNTYAKTECELRLVRV